MKTNTNTNPSALDDILYAFSLSSDAGTRASDLLDEYIRRHPDFADELTELAIDLAVHALRPVHPVPTADCGVKGTKRSSAVSIGMSSFQNRLHTLRQEADQPSKEKVSRATGVANPFESLSRSAFRKLAQELNSNTVFVGKLRDRLIDPTTFTDGFIGRVSEILDSQPETVRTHLFAAPQVISSQQYFKSDQKPQVQERQTFEEAVRSADLTVEQRAYLLGL
jgi:hypothetical protein